MLRGDLAAPFLDVASDQIRALRSRMFMADIASGQVRGSLLRMGNSVREVHMRAHSFPSNPAEYDAYLSDAEVVEALSFPSGLKAIPLVTFDLISRHGYELADAILTTHCSGEFRRSFQWAAGWRAKPRVSEHTNWVRYLVVVLVFCRWKFHRSGSADDGHQSSHAY